MSRAPVTLSREMKIGLIALAMLALLGGWLVMNNRQTSVDTVTPTPAVDSTASGSTAAPGADTAQGTGSTDTGSTGTGTTDTGSAAAGSSGEIPSAPGTVDSASGETVTAPPFPVTDPNGSTPDPTVPAPAPSGINPDTPLLSLNGRNPFRPIRLEEAEGTAASGAIAAQPAPTSTPVTITQPSSSSSQINDALATSSSGGAVPVSPIPVSSTASTSGSRRTGTSGGAIPISPLPGTPTVSVPAPTIPTRTANRPAAGSTSATPVRTSPANVPSSTVSIPSGSAATSTPERKPIIPPVTAVREPTVNIPGVSAQGGQTTNDGSASTPSLGPSTPAAITDTQPPIPVNASQPTTGEQTQLDAYLKEHQLVFDAAVLGPVNTAILRSDKGFLVATAGQTLTDTKIVLKEVTASSATFALGQATTTLQLDKR